MVQDGNPPIRQSVELSPSISSLSHKYSMNDPARLKHSSVIKHSLT